MRERESSLPAWSVIVIPLLCYVGVRLLVLGAAALRASVRGVGFEDAARAVVLDPLDLAAIQLVAFGGALFFGLTYFARGVRTRDALAISPVKPEVIGLAVIGGLALQFPLAELGNLVQELAPISLEDQILRQRMVTPDGLGSALAIVIAFVVVAPLSEELVFRGFLFTGLRDRHTDAFALFTTSLAFGAVHGELTAMVYATAAGLVLGSVALQTGSTLPSMAMHAAVNAVPVLLPERLVAIDGFNTVSERVYHLRPPLLLGTAAVVAASIFVMHRLSRDDQDS